MQNNEHNEPDEKMLAELRRLPVEALHANDKRQLKHALHDRMDQVDSTRNKRPNGLRSRGRGRRSRVWPSYLAAGAAVVIAGAGVAVVTNQHGTQPSVPVNNVTGSTKTNTTANTVSSQTGPLANLAPAKLTYINEMTMTGPQTGLMDGFNGKQFAIAMTTDGGTSWMSIPIPGNAPARVENIQSAPQAALVQGNEVLLAWDVNGKTGAKTVIDTTTDWGAHWQTHTIQVPNTGASVGNISSFGKRIWLLQSYQGTAMGRTQHTLQVSNDGGATWQAISVDSGYVPAPSSLQVTPHALPESFGLTQYPSLFTWRSPSRGFAAMTDDGGMAPLGVVPLLVTTDGGHTWQQASITAPSGVNWSNSYMTVSLPVFAGQQGVLTIATSGKHDTLTVYGTSDGGAHWQAVHQVNVSGSPVSVSFVNPTTGWYLNQQTGRLMKTTDGGQSWQQVHASGLFNLSPQGGQQVSFQMQSASTGVAVVTQLGGQSSQGFTSVLYRTTDGGETWVKTKLG